MKLPSIGNVKLRGWCALAPMAGVSDLAYRVIAMDMGAAMTTTEMVSSRGIFHHNEKTLEMLKIDPTEHPVALQIFGNDPDIMAEAGQVAEAAGADIVDINMGCPMLKVVKNGDGSALMKHVSLAHDIVKAIVRAVHIPVTVKMRIGWNRSLLNAPELAQAVEEAGAAAVTVHGRTKEELYSGHADWGEIRRVVEAVKIPVWGNGDVVDGKSAKALLEETGCAGVAIGRAAWGNPWIFREVNAYIEKGIEISPPTREERLAMAKRHLIGLVAEKGEYIAVREMRAHASHYFHGLPRATALRREIMKAESVEAFLNLLESYKQETKA